VLIHFSDQQSASGRHHWSRPGHALFEFGAGPTVHVDVGDVRPQKARRWADGGCGPPRPESRHVRPHVGASGRANELRDRHDARQEEGTCNSGGESYDVRPPRVEDVRWGHEGEE